MLALLLIGVFAAIAIARGQGMLPIYVVVTYFTVGFLFMLIFGYSLVFDFMLSMGTLFYLVYLAAQERK